MQLQCLLVALGATAAHARLSDYVDLLIGTEGPTAGSAIAGGNAFPGAALPWGMVKAGIDTSYLGLPENYSTDCNAGFSPWGNVTGVSLMHVSGTGGVPSYGLISQMPLRGTLDKINLADNNTYAQNRSLESEVASVGHFTTTLLDDTKIDITASNHSAWIKYSFPTKGNNKSHGDYKSDASPSDHPDAFKKSDNDVHVLVDLTHVLPAHDPDSQTYGQKFLQGDLKVRQGKDQPSYSGSASYTGGWSQAASHKIYFCGNFSLPAGSQLTPTNAYARQVGPNGVPGAGTFSWQYDPVPQPDTQTSSPDVWSNTEISSSTGGSMGLGALFSWTVPASTSSNATSQIESKIGISYLSEEQACRYTRNELPANQTLEGTIRQARKEWENKVLSTVEVVDDGSSTSSNKTLMTMLYTALYHSALLPTDKTGENPYWNSSDARPYFDDHYTLWDTYRTVMPIHHLLFTNTYARIVKGLINIFTFEGFLPAGRIANWNGRVQGGSHADVVIGDAYSKSVKFLEQQEGLGELGDIDWKEAYKAVRKDGEVFPVRNQDSVTFDGATKEGRGGLDDYLAYHFVTRNHSRSISRGLEYSTDDFSIYTLGHGLDKSGKTTAHYRDRASWWENQWNPFANTTLKGYGEFTGFAGPRDSTGKFNFTEYDPIECNGGCSWPDDIYEAKVWETSFSAAPQDMARVIELMGGDDDFVKRLDVSFIPGLGSSVGANNDAGTALFNPGNEPSFPMPFLYNYVPGKHWKTANQTRNTVDAFFSTSHQGYPGNIDAGAIPSWLVFTMLGFYPIAGQPIYLLGAPRFSSVKVTMFQDTPFENVLAIKAPNLADNSYYPQKVTLDGKELDRSWLTHSELAHSEELVFHMGEKPASWDMGDRPWSMSTYGSK